MYYVFRLSFPCCFFFESSWMGKKVVAKSLPPHPSCYYNASWHSSSLCSPLFFCRMTELRIERRKKESSSFFLFIPHAWMRLSQADFSAGWVSEWLSEGGLHLEKGLGGKKAAADDEDKRKKKEGRKKRQMESWFWHILSVHSPETKRKFFSWWQKQRLKGYHMCECACDMKIWSCCGGKGNVPGNNEVVEFAS